MLKEDVIMPYLELYSMRDGKVQDQSGLNWCFADAHVNTCDAYIALTVKFFRNNPTFFPSHGSVIRTEWDDGVVINCLLEGTQSFEGETYPKQISSVGDKSVLGEYFRKRLGVTQSHVISRADLQIYGRDNVEVTHKNGFTYYFDFHV